MEEEGHDPEALLPPTSLHTTQQIDPGAPPSWLGMTKGQ